MARNRSRRRDISPLITSDNASELSRRGALRNVGGEDAQTPTPTEDLYRVERPGVAAAFLAQIARLSGTRETSGHVGRGQRPEQVPDRRRPEDSARADRDARSTSHPQRNPVWPFDPSRSEHTRDPRRSASRHPTSRRGPATDREAGCQSDAGTRRSERTQRRNRTGAPSGSHTVTISRLAT